LIKICDKKSVKRKLGNIYDNGEKI